MVSKSAVRRLYEAGLDDAAIGQRLGCTARHVCGLRALLRLTHKNGRNRPWLEADERELVMLRQTGLTFGQIAERVGRTEAAVQMRFRAIVTAGRN